MNKSNTKLYQILTKDLRGMTPASDIHHYEVKDHEIVIKKYDGTETSIPFTKEEEDKITLSDYLTQITLYSERAEDADHDAVKIMTIHTAKGLEFPCVFVAGLNEGTLPNSHAVTPEAIEQERRVAYVAITRAEELLFLSSDNPDRFSFQGEKLDLSRFVYELSNKSPKDHRA